ncbi:MAG: hypothetical protein MZW92_04510 [Comamonadaceae bacterium]|nr:hypothetical protein [Comamonadaceae bacterium]
MRAGLQAARRRHPARATPTTCCTRWCTVMQRRPGGEDLQARRQLRHAARPDRLDQPRRGALLPASAARPTPSSSSTSTWRCKATTRTRSSTCSTRTRASARCWRSARARGARRDAARDADLSPLTRAQRARADAAAGRSTPRC